MAQGSGTHVFAVRVFYEDTDMAGIVYHANYLKYIERARSDWVLQQGLDQNAMREAGIVFVVSRIEADYLAPARFDDRLEVRTSAARMSGVRLVMDQSVFRDTTCLFRARVTAVCAAPDGRPMRLPPVLRDQARGPE